METIELLISIGGCLVFLIVGALVLIFARVVLVPMLILAAIGAFLGAVVDNAIGSGTCFATVGAVAGGLIGAVGGLKFLGGGG